MNKELVKQIKEIMIEVLENEMKSFDFNDMDKAYEAMNEGTSMYDNLQELCEEEIIELYGYLVEEEGEDYE